MPTQRIQAQDPSLSPTYAMSAYQQPPSVRPSIRRNLFSAHLTRRPVSSTPNNPFGPSSPTHQPGQLNQDVFSGPMLQPTKRSTNLQDLYDPNTSPSSYPLSPSSSANLFPRESIIAVHPITGRPVLTNLPTLPPRLDLSQDEEEEDEEGKADDDYDDERHMNASHNNSRADGVGGSSNHFSHASSYADSMQYDEADLDLRSSLHPPKAHNISHFSSSSSSSFSTINPTQQPQHNLHLLIQDMTGSMHSEDSQLDRERIERVLISMVSQQRERARTIPLPESGSESSNSFSSLSAESGTDAHGGVAVKATSAGNGSHTDAPPSVTTRSSRRTAPGTRSQAQEWRAGAGTRAPQAVAPHHEPVSSATITSKGGVGATMDPVEKEEIMSLIMTSLRRKVAVADEEGWMYGNNGIDGGEGLGVEYVGMDGYG